MRWFFFAFITLLAAAGNAAIFEKLSVERVIGGLAYNAFIVALLVIWWASYFSRASVKTRALASGHALLMLAAGIGITLVGTNTASANTCEGLIFGNKPNGLLSQFATHLQTLGYCREFGLGIALFGLLMAYPSIRLFVGITRRSS